MRRTRVLEALNSAQARDALLVKGWVRTRRDAKGLSFLELNDGSCLKNLQVIVDAATPAAATLETITTGAAVEVEGALVASPGKNQQWEVHASALHLLGGADPDAYPLQKKRHSRTSSCAPSPTSAHAPTSTAPCSASARKRPSPCTSSFGSAVFTTCTPPSLPAPTARVPARCSASPPCPLRRRPALSERPDDGRRLFRQGGQPHRLRPTGGRAVRLCLGQRLHLWADVPGGKLQHPAARRRVLDDRAGNGVRRFARRHGPRRGLGAQLW